ncbi:MAG: transposase [Anaerolineales bacterium]|nr:transposase [Anaerolineales bacterium]
MTFLNKLSEELPERYYLGLDVGYKAHVAVVVSLEEFLQNGESWKKAPFLEFPSTQAGLEKLQTYLNSFCPRPEAYLGLCEPTGGFYGVTVYQYLLSQGYPMWWIENSLTRHMREKIFGHIPKTDPMDARVMTRLGYLHEAVGEEFSLRPLHLLVPEDRELLQLCRDAWKVKSVLTRARNQFTQLMAVVFPELKTFFTKSVSSIAPVTLMHHFPSPTEIATAAPEAITEVLWEVGSYHHAKRADELQGLARSSSGVLPDPGRAWRLSWLTEYMLNNFQAKATLDRYINERVVARPEYRLLSALPYTTPISLGMIIAATGDVDRFSNYRKYVAYTGYFAGLDTSQTIDRTRMSKRGNRDLKRTYFQIAAALVWFDPGNNPYKKLFQRKMEDGRPWYKAMPFVCAALARHVYHCLKYEDPYDLTKAFGTSSAPASEASIAEEALLSVDLEEKYDLLDAQLTEEHG